MEDALKILDKLTQEEAWMISEYERVVGVTEQPERVLSVDDRVDGINDRMAGVNDRVTNVNNKVVEVIRGV